MEPFFTSIKNISTFTITSTEIGVTCLKKFTGRLFGINSMPLRIQINLKNGNPNVPPKSFFVNKLFCLVCNNADLFCSHCGELHASPGSNLNAGRWGNPGDGSSW